MKKLIGCLFAVVSVNAFAQLQSPCLPDANSKYVQNNQASSPSTTTFRSRSAFSPIIAVGHYGIDGEFGVGPTLGLQYTPNRRSNPAMEFNAGLVFGSRGTTDVVADPYATSSSFQQNRFMYIPQQSGRAGFGLNLGFVGADAIYYLADGNLRPYVGVGVRFFMWPYYGGMGGTVSPDLKAGLDVNISTGFAGFAEMRHSFGMPNLFGGYGTRFNGLTTLAFGFSFAPRF